MKTKYLLYQAVLLLGLMTVFSACQKDYPKNTENLTDEVVLSSIKILNAGENGDEVVEGTIDEFSKTVNFPRLDTLTDFSNLRFQADVSNGASLDQDSYDIGFEPGQSQKTIVVKVVHNKRFREYLVTLRLMVPVFGGDFSKTVIYDNSLNPLGNPVYPSFTGLNTRGSGFDGNFVLVVTRPKEKSSLIPISDVRSGDVSNAIALNTTGIEGGTYPVNVGAQINGHTYITSLSGSNASPFRIYHWTDPNQAPEIIGDFSTGTIPDIGARYGDNMSADLDENGNGYFFFGDNAVSRILRIKVTNYTTLSDPKTFPNATGSSFVMTFDRVGNTEDYLYTGYDAPIRVANADATISYTLPSSTIPLNCVAAKVVYYNGERYLLTATSPRYAGQSPSLLLYDITKGDDIKEALQILADDGADSHKLIEYPLGGEPNSAPGTQTGWSVSKDADGKDDVLTIYAASADAGFVVIDIPKKTLED